MLVVVVHNNITVVVVVQCVDAVCVCVRMELRVLECVWLIILPGSKREHARGHGEGDN